MAPMVNLGITPDTQEPFEQFRRKWQADGYAKPTPDHPSSAIEMGLRSAPIERNQRRRNRSREASRRRDRAERQARRAGAPSSAGTPPRACRGQQRPPPRSHQSVSLVFHENSFGPSR